MKRIILIIGAIGTLVLAILWYFDKVTEPLVAVGTGILTFLGYLLIPDEQKQIKKIKQKHSGIGDNIAGNKTVNN